MDKKHPENNEQKCTKAINDFMASMEVGEDGFFQQGSPDDPETVTHTEKRICKSCYPTDPAHGPYTFVPEKGSFQHELAALINAHSMENGSNTPDFILADFMRRVLDSFNVAVRSRDMWGSVESDYNKSVIDEIKKQLDGLETVITDYCSVYDYIEGQAVSSDGDELGVIILRIKECHKTLSGLFRFIADKWKE